MHACGRLCEEMYVSHKLADKCLFYRFRIKVRREDLDIQCNFSIPINYTIDDDAAPAALTQALREVTNMLEQEIDDYDEERCLKLLKAVLECAYFSFVGPPPDTPAQNEPDTEAQEFSSVNVNTASAKDMEKALSGVGSVAAGKIINARPYTSVSQIGERVPSLKAKIPTWEGTKSVRVDGEAFLKGRAKQGANRVSMPAGSVSTPLETLREVQCALKFLAKVEELSKLPDAMQARQMFLETGKMPDKIGGDLRSSRSGGTKMCMLRNCPATGRVIINMLCSRHILKNWRTAVCKGKSKDAPPLSRLAYSSTLHMAENKVPLEEGKAGSAMSVGEANGLDPMSVGYATKLFSFKMLSALRNQIMVVMDDGLQESMLQTLKWVEPGAKFDTATDHRGYTIDERKAFLDDVCKFNRHDVLTKERIDCAHPGPYINGISKCTSEATEITCFGIKKLYEICEQIGGKAATWVNARATSSDACEQLFAGTQNLSKEQFINAINKRALTLRNLQDPDNAFYMPMNSITKNAKHSHGCFNEPSARHDVPVIRSVDDNTTTIGATSLRVKANSKARKA